MKVLILGWDGYIGYPLTQHLLKKDHKIFGIDNFSRRKRVESIGGDSLTPIARKELRLNKLKVQYLDHFNSVSVNLGKDSPTYIKSILAEFLPDAIIHLAEQPSAPWSMVDPFKAAITQQENVIGTLQLLWAMKDECPGAHLIKLGTMGEYGTPDCVIPEGVIPELCCQVRSTNPMIVDDIICPMSGLLFPRTPGSFYHLSKVHDTFNVNFACRNWGLSSTDIMQGVLFGLNETDDVDKLTRFDYDEYFGTVINRFCAQAIIGHPLTVYGKGRQHRGFLPLKDSIQCLTIALNSPPKPGEYRTFNQFENVYSINQLASMVCEGAKALGLRPSINHIKNPRKEAEDHYYNPINDTLFGLGYVPTTNTQPEITSLIEKILPYKKDVHRGLIMPNTKWA